MSPSEEIVREILKDDISLSGLTSPINHEEACKRMREGDKEREEYKKKYGDDWLDVYMRDKGDIVDYSRDIKRVNKAIYGRYKIIINSPHAYQLLLKEDERIKKLFGKKYDIHNMPKKELAEKVLLKDAVKTGKWKELPDELQNKYHELVGDLS